jgi:hypothetical protein
MARFVAAKLARAPAKPSSGITKKPAPREPTIEPKVFAAYTWAVANPASCSSRARMRTASGKVAPIRSAAGKRVDIEMTTSPRSSG